MFQKALKQDESYHDFADKRTICEIPNCNDVVSNLPFILIGIYGLFRSYGNNLFLPWSVFFLGSVAVGFGSSYYHWHPTSPRLFWDRLPMTIGFMSLFSIVLHEQLDYDVHVSLFIFVTLGVGSTLIWKYTGLLLPYVIVQYVPIVIYPYLLTVKENPNTGLYLVSGLFYILAKVTEVTDKQIYCLTNYTVSGHTIKHYLAALAIFTLVYVF